MFISTSQSTLTAEVAPGQDHRPIAGAAGMVEGRQGEGHVMHSGGFLCPADPLRPGGGRRGRRAHAGAAARAAATAAESYPSTPAGEKAPGAITMIGSLERTEICLVEARACLRRLLDQIGLCPAGQFDILLAAGEAFTNAVRYGRGGAVQWSYTVSVERVVVVFEYESDRFDTSGNRKPGHYQENGRGLMLMHALMDDVRFRFAKGQVRVSMTKQLPG